MNRSLACAATAVTILCLLEPSGGAQTPVKTAAGAPPPAAAATTGRFSALFGVHRFDQVAISPDGRSLAWVELLMGMDGAANGKNVIQVSAARAGATPRRITAGPAAATYDEGHVSWSPDSKRIAFLSDAAKSGQLQLYVVDAAGGAARKLTSVKGFLNGPSWSPDGKTLAVLFMENATRAAGPLVAGTPETGEIKDAFFEQRLALVDVATGQLRQISPAEIGRASCRERVCLAV